MQSTETGEEGERVTREENLLYRRSCPYDAMGDYSLLIEKQQMKSTESETSFSGQVERGTDSAVAAYTVILCFSLMKTANLSRSIFNAH